MSTLTESSLFCRTLDWIKARAARDNELATMSRADLQVLAADIGVTEADLRDVVPRIGDHSDLIDKMMRARNLDPKAVRRAFGGVVRDMEVTCARCRDSGTCRLELEAGTAGAHSHEFCGNADAMDDLLAA
jgi:hypothetical protein